MLTVVSMRLSGHKTLRRTGFVVGQREDLTLRVFWTGFVLIYPMLYIPKNSILPRGGFRLQ
jgi:hypothetical protein